MSKSIKLRYLFQRGMAVIKSTGKRVVLFPAHPTLQASSPCVALSLYSFRFFTRLTIASTLF